MYAKLHHFRPSFVALGAVALSACATQSGPTPATSALTSGRIDRESGSNASVDVRAYDVESDGSLVIASEIGQTDASGRFTLDATISETATALVVIAEDGSGRMTLLTRSAIDASVDGRADATLTMAPITRASSLDAEVAIAIERRIDGSSDAASLDSLFLTGALSSELAADASREATVDAAAGATLDARATFLAALDAEVDGSARGDARLVVDSMAQLEADLAIALDAAASLDAEDRAWATFFDASVETMLDAGYDAEGIASASLAARSSLDAHLAGHVSSGAASLSLFTAFATTAAIDSDLATRLESSSIVSAGATLRTDAMTQARARADATATASAWTRYDAVIDAELSERMGVLSTVLVDLRATLDVSATALIEAWVALGVDASAMARVDAYATYAESVSSSANASLLIAGGLTTDEAEASLDAMAMVHVMTN